MAAKEKNVEGMAFIVEALKKTGGNRAKAAKLLKISRASLYNKLRAYRID